MCEKMEEKTEEQIIKHTQHTRILKEEDEIWISSEDLNTENSTDDERSKSKHGHKKKLKLKQRKRSSPNIKLQRPSISSVPSTSKALDERLLRPHTEDFHSRSDESRTSDEEYSRPSISPDCLSKRLSLEDWRPTRGSLTISSLEEATATAGDTRKIISETSNFRDALLYKLKFLKSCSVLRSTSEEKRKEKERQPNEVNKTFKYLKNTAEVKQKLEFINKLDEEIKETISNYKNEREERLATEFEMCKSISEHKLCQERGAEEFLKLCNFEERLKLYKQKAGLNAEEVTKDDCLSEISDKDAAKKELFNAADAKEDNFVKKNIFAAKEGIMASFSLTDEEKSKIATILKDIDDFQLDDADLSLSTEALSQENNATISETNTTNAYRVQEEDKTRINEIDTELEKFTEDENNTEKNNLKKYPPVVKDEEFWKQYVLDQSLKEIDAKLEKLYQSYVEDEEKLKNWTGNDEAGNEVTA